jgi:CRISPR-associated protein Cmr1
VVDPELPVRASAIRGQLRYWWRLLQPRTAAELLFAAESELWGGISREGPTASQVRLRVLNAGPVKLTPAFQYVTQPGQAAYTPKQVRHLNAYALFPAQSEPTKLAEPGIDFTLEIACPSAHWPDVEKALRWWATFGGLGARTRRGLGAVEIAGLEMVNADEVVKAGGRLALRNPCSNAMDAWNEAVDRLKLYRQGEGCGRNPGNKPNRPGRSRWPEPDMIRRLTKKHAEGHKPQHPLEKYYPRAAFGLPIVFHFQSSDDPEQVILEPNDDRHDRMASPLVLRPYRAHGGKYQPAALLLPGWEKALNTDLRLKDKPTHQRLDTWPSKVNTAQRQAAAAQIRPLAENSAASDPLSAFMDFFAREGS